MQISLNTHRELYHDWRRALAFCRTLPDVSPDEAVTFHMFWRQRRGRFWLKPRLFGRKQALSVKSFFATQDRERCSLVLWSDDDLASNEWLRPFAPHMTFRVYDAASEVRGTQLEGSPAIYRQRDRRVWRDGDLFRALVLYNYGGIYVDMDMVLLRSLGVFLDREFLYQWHDCDDQYNGAILRLRRGSDFARELLAGVAEIPPQDSSWGRANFHRAFARGVKVDVLPSPFFDADWQAESTYGKFRPFRRTANVDLMDGAFAWHWHNHWDDRIEERSKFQLYETLIDARLAAIGLGR